MDKATTKRLGNGLRKKYEAPPDLPEAMRALLDALRDNEKPKKHKLVKHRSKGDSS